MDRFIGTKKDYKLSWSYYLKSNMDRFIVLHLIEDVLATYSFKIQYG